MTKTAPDHIFVHGTLKSGTFVSVNYRTPNSNTVSGTGVRWTITGTEGEIEITTPETSWQSRGPGRKIRLKDRKSAEVQEVDFRDPYEPLYVSAMDIPATNPARVYEALTKENKSRYATFEDAVETHRVLDGIRIGSL